MEWREKNDLSRLFIFFFFIYNYVLFGFVYDKLSRIILNHFVSTYLKMINARRLTNKLLGTIGSESSTLRSGARRTANRG